MLAGRDAVSAVALWLAVQPLQLATMCPTEIYMNKCQKIE